MRNKHQAVPLNSHAKAVYYILICSIKIMNFYQLYNSFIVHFVYFSFQKLSINKILSLNYVLRNSIVCTLYEFCL